MLNKISKREREKLELIRKIELCKRYKKGIIKFVEDLNRAYHDNIIDYATYKERLDKNLEGKTAEEWSSFYENYINSYNKKLSELEERKVNISVLSIIGVLIMLGVAFFFVRPTITGYFVAERISMISVDGYDIEGTKWAEIKGNRLYERCLKVNSDIEFNSVIVTAKITDASDKKNLVFGIYNNSEKDEPFAELGDCKVTDYSGIWKSCEIKLKETRKSDNYWACGYADDENSNVTYYMIAHHPGDYNKRALWTGNYWQKLDRASYTIKAEFVKWG